MCSPAQTPCIGSATRPRRATCRCAVCAVCALRGVGLDRIGPWTLCGTCLPPGPATGDQPSGTEAGRAHRTPARPPPPQLAALQRRAKRAEEEAAPPEPEVKVSGPDGVPRALTMSTLRSDVATRAALLHEVATQAEDVEDQIASLLQRVRQRFDRAGVPMQDVQIRFKGLSVSGMAAVRSLKPLPSSLLVEAVRVRVAGPEHALSTPWAARALRAAPGSSSSSSSSGLPCVRVAHDPAPAPTLLPCSARARRRGASPTGG